MTRVVLLTCATIVGTTVVAADWPVFRGTAAMTGMTDTKLPDPLVERWTFRCKDSVESAPAIVGGVVYVASMDKHLYAIDLATGKAKWKSALSGPTKASPAVRDGKVYVGDSNGKLFCLNAADGKPVWTFEVEGMIGSGVNFYADTVLVGSQDLPLYCVGPDGKKRWEFAIDGGSNGTPAVAEGKVFASGCDSLMHVIDAVTGKEVGSVDLGGQAAGSTAIVGDRAYVGTMTNQVLALDWKQLKSVWQFEPRRRAQPFYASAAVTDSLVVIGSRDKKVYALDRSTGSEAWSFITEGMVDASPVVAGNRVYVGALSSGGEFYVLDLNTGRQVQVLDLEGAVPGSAAVGSDCVVVGTEKGAVYCLGAAK